MPLFPPQDYRKTHETHRRGTLANQPSAINVLTGTLYYATDNGILYRSDGTNWQTYSGTTAIDISTTGTIQNLDITDVSLVRLTGGSTMTVHSLTAGYPGQRVTFITTAITGLFRHNSSTLGGGKALTNFIKVTDADTPITDNDGAVTYQYDSVGSQWRMIAHTQGDPIVPTFAAGDFTGSGAMTWTLTSGDVKQDGYLVNGKEVTYYFRYATTSIGGTPSTQLQRAIPALLAPLNDFCFNTCIVSDNGATQSVGVCLVANGASIIGIQKIDASNWAASTNNTYVEGQLKWFTI